MLYSHNLEVLYSLNVDVLYSHNLEAHLSFNLEAHLLKSSLQIFFAIQDTKLAPKH